MSNKNYRTVSLKPDTYDKIMAVKHIGQSVDGYIQELLDLADKYETLVRKYSSDELHMKDGE